MDSSVTDVYTGLAPNVVILNDTRSAAGALAYGPGRRGSGALSIVTPINTSLTWGQGYQGTENWISYALPSRVFTTGVGFSVAGWGLCIDPAEVWWPVSRDA